MPDATRNQWVRPALPAGMAAALLLSLLTLVSPTPVQATSTYLCTGYTACANAGYSHAGYATANSRMYWRMYSGHNCTNYAAYRMIRAGMPAERPWSGSGMAYNWGLANASITDQTPTVGSIAWWNRNTGGVGSSGHVAYVERVISSREIIISEDSWGGDFDWRRIVKDGSGWPSGFIHFKDQAPAKVITSTGAPTIVGTPQVGVPLQATPGTWAGAPNWFGYQWLANGVAIPGATATTFTSTAAQVGAAISLQVTAKRSGYQPGIATSTPSAPVAKGAFTVVSPTAVSGTPMVGQVLTATPGTFSPAPERTTLQWRVNGQVIPGATAATLPLDSSMVGKTITAASVAQAAGFARSGSRSAPTSAVLAGAIEVTTPYAVIGRPRFGETLTIQPGTYTPPDAAFYYAWLRDGAPIPGAFAAAYQLTEADVGHEVSAAIRLAKAHHLGRTEMVPGGLVRTTPTVEAAATGWPRRAAVNVRVTAPGSSAVSGKVVVKVAGKKITASVSDGRARIVVPNLTPGKHQVTVRYLGSSVIETGTDTVIAWVKR